MKKSLAYSLLALWLCCSCRTPSVVHVEKTDTLLRHDTLFLKQIQTQTDMLYCHDSIVVVVDSVGKKVLKERYRTIQRNTNRTLVSDKQSAVHEQRRQSNQEKIQMPAPRKSRWYIPVLLAVAVAVTVIFLKRKIGF